MRLKFFTAALVSYFVSLSVAGCPYATQGNHRESRSEHQHQELCISSSGKKGIFYFNRISPSQIQLYIANSDGSNATLLMGDQSLSFDFHASWSPDGEWIVFSSERRADGQSDIYRVKPDGSGVQELVKTDSFEDAGALSPDGTKLAYVSTIGNHTANVWVKDLQSGITTNLTDTTTTRGDPSSPQGHFRPSWSPDGQWIAFSSDRNTDWTGHSNGTGWEHTQTLSIYMIRPDGSDFRRVVNKPDYSLGAPQWSPDGSRILFSQISTEQTYGAHGSSHQSQQATSQLVSVDVATGQDLVIHTSGPYLKLGQHYIGNSSNVGYLIKGGSNAGINYTNPDSTHTPFIGADIRNPSWSPDGSKLIYEIHNWDIRPAGKELFSWDKDWDYRFTDVFPQYNDATGRIAVTQKQLGNSSIITSMADFTDLIESFDVWDVFSTSNETEQGYIESGTGGAFQPTWSPDGAQIALGMGTWFFNRNINPASIYLANSTGDGFMNLTEKGGQYNAGFPSFSPNGDRLVYRLWDWINRVPMGLRILDLETGNTSVLTSGWDNTPGWSPDGERIVFTRQVNWTAEYGRRWYSNRFDIMTIRPDGSELTRLTDSPSSDAHAVWSYDGQTMWSTGMYGFRDESSLYDNTFQPYGQIMIMDADGSNKKILTDSMWEDSMPMYVPNRC